MRTMKRIISIIAVMLCVILLCSCGDQGSKEASQPQTQIASENTGDNQNQQAGDKSNQQNQQAGDKSGEQGQQVDEQQAEQQEQSEPQAVHDPKKGSEVIEKIQGASDDHGIYAIVITLSDKAADKGEVEMVYHGEKGSPQENSVVNTLLIQYYKKDSGSFEISTFFDGEVYQNLHDQAKVKFNNTFSANLRAGDVTIFYTPDGGEKQEIYYADASQFK